VNRKNSSLLTSTIFIKKKRKNPKKIEKYFIEIKKKENVFVTFFGFNL